MHCVIFRYCPFSHLNISIFPVKSTGNSLVSTITPFAIPCKTINSKQYAWVPYVFTSFSNNQKIAWHRSGAWVPYIYIILKLMLYEQNIKISLSTIHFYIILKLIGQIAHFSFRLSSIHFYIILKPSGRCLSWQHCLSTIHFYIILKLYSSSLTIPICEGWRKIYFL